LSCWAYGSFSLSSFCFAHIVSSSAESLHYSHSNKHHIMILSNKVGILSALIALSPNAVTSHGYMKTPRSRNYHTNLNGKWSGGTANDPAPGM
jgi:hypothetical protein